MNRKTSPVWAERAAKRKEIAELCKTRTMADVAKEYGVSAQRIQQICKQAGLLKNQEIAYRKSPALAELLGKIRRNEPVRIAAEAAAIGVTAQCLYQYLGKIGTRWEPARVPRRVFEHGTPPRYNQGCRCDQCREANRLRHKSAREKRKTRTPPQHGYSGYTNFSCRCDVCKKAGRDYNRKMRANRKQKLLDKAAGGA